MKVLKPVKFNTPVTGQFIRGSTATYFEDGILKTAAINEPRWQDGELLLEGKATNKVLNSQGDTVVFAAGTTPPVVVTGVAHLGISCSSGTFAAGSNVGFNGSRMISSGVTMTTGVEAVGSSWLSLSRPLTGSEVIGYYWFGCPVVLITAANSADFVGQWRRVETSDAVTGSGTNTAMVYPAVSPLSDVTVYWCRHQWEEGRTAATSYIPTTTAAVTRSADICIGNFSRASTATYIDASGVIQTAAVNVPRIQNDKLLVESAATNLLLNSTAFNNATYWTPSGLTFTTSQSSPDGASNAVKIVETTLNGAHSIQSTLFSSGKLTFSVFAKAAERSWVAIRIGSYTAWFNLSTGNFGTIDPYLESYSATSIGNSWYRISISVNTFAASSSVAVFVCNANNVLSYTGTTGSGLFIFGAQLESGYSITSYIPTITTAVTRSADLHTAGIVYSNAVESTASWSSATTYSVGQKVRYNNTIYESLQGTNLNKQPDTNPTWWLSLGADNITAAIDGKVGTKTVATDKLRMIVYPDSAIDAIGYIECSTNSISTSVVDTDYNMVYSYKTNSSDSITQVVHQGVNSLYPNVILGVEMARSGSVELGSIVVGQTTEIGKTQYGLKAGIVDYSRKQADEFGNIVLVERTYSKRLEGDVYVYNYNLNNVQRFLYNIRATPVLWIASDDPELAEVSNVYGFYKDFSTTISYPDVSMCSLQIEGLT